MTSTLPVLLCSALLHPHALAQVAPQVLSDCAAIASDSQRLACFDRISGRTAPRAAAPKPDAAPAAAPAAAPTPASNPFDPAKWMQMMGGMAPAAAPQTAPAPAK